MVFPCSRYHRKYRFLCRRVRPKIQCHLAMNHTRTVSSDAAKLQSHTSAARLSGPAQATAETLTPLYTAVEQLVSNVASMGPPRGPSC